MIVVEDAALPHTGTIVLAVFATVALSVYAHGLSARSLTDRYVHWYATLRPGRLPPMESVDTPEQRPRGTGT